MRIAQVSPNFVEIGGELIEGYPFVKPVIDDSLILWLDGSTGNNYEQTGTWKDLSGNDNDGQLMNFNYDENSGWVDGGLKFDGVDDYVDCGDKDEFDLAYGGTLEIIAKSNREYPNDTTTTWYRGLISKRLSGKAGYGSYYLHWTGTNQTRTLRVGLTVGDRSEVLQIYDFDLYSKYRHIVAVWGNGFFRLYSDGVCIKETVYNEMVQITQDPLRIGNAFGYGFFDGDISLVRIYNRALTDEEILQNYQAGQCSPLLAMRGDVIG